MGGASQAGKAGRVELLQGWAHFFLEGAEAVCGGLEVGLGVVRRWAGNREAMQWLQG